MCERIYLGVHSWAKKEKVAEKNEKRDEEIRKEGEGRGEAGESGGASWEFDNWKRELPDGDFGCEL